MITYQATLDLPIDILRAVTGTGHDLWYSGKNKKHGGNIQVLCGPGGYPEWVAPVEPGSTHDITAARLHVLPARKPHLESGSPRSGRPLKCVLRVLLHVVI